MNVSGEFTVNAPRDVVFETLRDPKSFVRFVDGVQRSQGNRPDPLRGDVRDQGRLHEIQVHRDGRGHAASRAARDRGQDRRHAARRGRPADREIDHHADRRRRRDQGHLFGRSRRSPASSAASASRCCGPRPRTWKRYSPTRLRARFAQAARGGRNDPVRSRRTEVARRRDQAARSRRSRRCGRSPAAPR